LTASAAEVRFSRATGAKSSLSRLSFSSTQLEKVLPFRRAADQPDQPDLVRPSSLQGNQQVTSSKSELFR
jgi:hypothetical protein